MYPAPLSFLFAPLSMRPEYELSKTTGERAYAIFAGSAMIERKNFLQKADRMEG